jgi:hypothetical protein
MDFIDIAVCIISLIGAPYVYFEATTQKRD